MSTPHPLALGALLRRYRVMAGLTQEALAERASLSSRAISDLERGVNRTPQPGTLDLLAEALELSREERAHFEALARRARLATRLSPPVDMPGPWLETIQVYPVPQTPASVEVISGLVEPVSSASGTTLAERAGNLILAPQPLSYRSQLPIPPTPLIGREQEVAAVCALLQRPEVHLLTLTGSAGVGKTRLALQVAATLIGTDANDVYFIPLSALSDPELVLPTIAQALGLRDTGAQTVLTLLADALHEQQAVLVLDNFEQVIRAAPHLAALLEISPRLKLLITSREVLHLRAEHQLVVLPLTLPALPRRVRDHTLDHIILEENPAVQLFLHRVQDTQPDFHLTPGNATTIAQICLMLEGIPLAMELAAPRLKLLSPQALLARLGGRLHVLTGGAGDLPERQRTMRATIAWSYELLTPLERALLRRLAIFVNGWTLAAAESVWQAAGVMGLDLLEGLGSLLDKSLVQQEPGSEEGPRFRMLYVLREFGLEQLEATEEGTATREAHATYYLRLAEEAEPELRGTQQTLWLQRLEQDDENLRAALRWWSEQGNDGREMALRFAAALQRFWQSRGLSQEGRAFLEQALAESQEVVAVVRAKAFQAAARLALGQGDYDRGEELCRESLNLYRELGERRGIAYCLFLLGWIARDRVNLARSRSLLEESLMLWRELGDQENIAHILDQLGYVLSVQGDYAGADALFKESLAMHQKQGNKWGLATSRFLLAHLHLYSQGDPVLVRALLDGSLVLYREVGDQENIAEWLWVCGRFALAQGDASRARELAEESAALAREMGQRWDIAGSFFILAKVALVKGDHAAARACYRESLTLAREVGYQIVIASCLEGLAGVLSTLGKSAGAACLWGAAEALRDSFGAPLPPIDQAEYERSVTLARVQIGEVAFTAAWAEGRQLTPEQALVAAGEGAS